MPKPASVQVDAKSPTDRASLSEDFVRLLGQLKRAVTAHIPPAISDQMASGATPHQLEALALLAHSDTGVTMNELAQQQNCALSTATALADRLERQGLAQRRDDPDDRRIVRVLATEQARTMVACALEGKRKMAQTLLAPLSDREVKELVTLLTKIVNTQVKPGVIANG